MLNKQETKEWTLSRMREFLGQLEAETDPMKIEGLTYTLMRTAEHAYNHLHDLNRQEVVKP